MVMVHEVLRVRPLFSLLFQVHLCTMHTCGFSDPLATKISVLADYRCFDVLVTFQWQWYNCPSPRLGLWFRLKVCYAPYAILVQLLFNLSLCDAILAFFFIMRSKGSRCSDVSKTRADMASIEPTMQSQTCLWWEDKFLIVCLCSHFGNHIIVP